MSATDSMHICSHWNRYWCIDLPLMLSSSSIGSHGLHKLLFDAITSFCIKRSGIATIQRSDINGINSSLSFDLNTIRNPRTSSRERVSLIYTWDYNRARLLRSWLISAVSLLHLSSHVGFFRDSLVRLPKRSFFLCLFFFIHMKWSLSQI